jgi:hypothetical protein
MGKLLRTSSPKMDGRRRAMLAEVASWQENLPVWSHDCVGLLGKKESSEPE